MSVSAIFRLTLNVPVLTPGLVAVATLVKVPLQVVPLSVPMNW